MALVAFWASLWILGPILVCVLRPLSILVSECGAFYYSDNPGSLNDASLHPLSSLSEAELDLSSCFYVLLFLLSSSSSSMDVSFHSWHCDSVWLESLLGFSTTVWNVGLLVVFGDSAEPVSVLQESPILN